MAMATTSLPGTTTSTCRSFTRDDAGVAVVRGRAAELERPIGLGRELRLRQRPAGHFGRSVSSVPTCSLRSKQKAYRGSPLTDVAVSWLGNDADVAYLRRCRLQINGKRYRQLALVVPKVVSSSSGGVESQAVTASAKETVPDTQFSITKVSFGTIGLTIGVSFLSFGFGSYFNLLPGAGVSALLLTYGFPLALIGFALKYAELKPVPCITYADAYALRTSQCTATLTQVREDVTRYRYGDEQHLEEALKRIFRYGRAGGIQRRNAPTLIAVREEVVNGTYTLVLVFNAPDLDLGGFESRKDKFASFFGPGVTAEMLQAGDKVYEVKLIANGGQPVVIA